MKNIYTDHVITIESDFVEGSVIWELGKYEEYRKLRCSAVYEFFKDSLKWAVLLNKNKLGVHRAQMAVKDAVGTGLDRYHVSIEWGIGEDVDGAVFMDEISKWLEECYKMLSTHIAKIERMEI